MDAERDAFAASVQRDINSVTDADRAVRRRAFDALSKRCALARDRSVDRSAARSIHWSPYDPVRVVNAVP